MNSKSEQRRAVVVAHPDDEVLWAGVLIAETRNQEGWRPWDVICCTVPRQDPERAIRFFESVRVLGGYPILLPFVEPEPNESIEHLEMLDLSPYTWVVTHNARGEYGHRHHKEVHKWVVASTVPTVDVFHPGTGRLQVDWEVSTKTEVTKNALRAYSHRAPADGGVPKWQALVARYHIDLFREGFNHVR